MEDAAGTLGAGPFWVFLTITLPLIVPGIMAGMILSFARALGEFGATIMFAGNVEGRTQTLPLLVYSEFQSSLDASVAAAAILVLALLAFFACAVWISFLVVFRGWRIYRTVLVWPFAKGFQLIGFDVGMEHIPVAPGRHISSGPGGLKVKAAGKRFGKKKKNTTSAE